MKHKIRVLIFILLIFLFHFCGNLFVLNHSTYLLTYDSINYFARVNEISQFLKKGKLDYSSAHKIYADLTDSHMSPHPSFFLYTAVPIFLFNNDKNTVVLVNLLYFIILLFATYGIGKVLFNPEVGILSSFFVSMFPTIFGLSRVFLLDFSLTAVVALTVYLFAIGSFEKLLLSFLSGLVIASGLLIKESYFIFLVPVAAHFIFKQRNRKERNKIYGFCFSIFTGVILSARFYIKVDSSLVRHWVNWPSNTEPFFYFLSMWNKQLLPIFFLLFIFSLLFSLKMKKFFLPVMVFILLTFFSVFPNKIDRFILPIFPLIAVMIANFVWSVLKGRKAVVVVLVVFVFLQFFFVSFSPLIAIASIKKHSSRTWEDYTDLTSIVTESDWSGPADRVIRIIRDATIRSGINKRIKLGLLASQKVYFAVFYSSIVNKLPLEIHIPPLEDIDRSNPALAEVAKSKEDPCFDNPVSHFSFVVIQENFPVKEIVSKSLAFNLISFKERFQDKYEFLSLVSFPDGSTGNIYKKKDIGI